MALQLAESTSMHGGTEGVINVEKILVEGFKVTIRIVKQIFGSIMMGMVAGGNFKGDVEMARAGRNT